MVAYTREQLLASGRRELAPRPSLPAPPFLMFDRITELDNVSGAFGKGVVRAEFDIGPTLWFFACHFEEDPVVPGCLQLDALWQMLGFFQGHHGAKGYGRALGAGEVEFTGQITRSKKLVTYTLHVKRARITEKVSMAYADGTVECDGKIVCTAKDLHVGVFPVIPE